MRRGAVRNGTLTALMRRICTDEHLVFRFRFHISVRLRCKVTTSGRRCQNYAELCRISNGESVDNKREKNTLSSASPFSVSKSVLTTDS